MSVDARPAMRSVSRSRNNLWIEGRALAPLSQLTNSPNSAFAQMVLEITMKRSAFNFGLVVFVCLSMSVLADTIYSFQTVIFPGDTFVQLFRINNAGKIAGYHGSGAPGPPHPRFTLAPPNHLPTQNFLRSLPPQP